MFNQIILHNRLNGSCLKIIDVVIMLRSNGCKKTTSINKIKKCIGIIFNIYIFDEDYHLTQPCNLIYDVLTSIIKNYTLEEIFNYVNDEQEAFKTGIKRY